MVLVGMICPFPPPFFLKLSIHIRGGEFHKNPFLESSIPSSTWNIFGEREFPYKNSFRIKSPKKKTRHFWEKKIPTNSFRIFAPTNSQGQEFWRGYVSRQSGLKGLRFEGWSVIYP